MKNYFIKFLLLILFVQLFNFEKVNSHSKSIYNFNYLDKLLVENSPNKNISELNINNSNIIKLLEILKRFDKLNSPRKTIVNGKVIYTYKKFPNDPKKSIKEIENLIKNPVNTKKYEAFIKKALLSLLSNAIVISIKDLEEKDLSGQWIHKDKTIVINQKILKEGIIYFAYLLSHEIIHVTQSCKGGSLESYPVLLGLNLDKPKSYYFKYLDNDFYKDLKKSDQMLEIEAYANQKKISQTLYGFKYFCLKQK